MDLLQEKENKKENEYGTDYNVDGFITIKHKDRILWLISNVTAYGYKSSCFPRQFLVYKLKLFFVVFSLHRMVQGVVSFIDRCPLFGVSFIGGSTVYPVWKL